MKVEREDIRRSVYGIVSSNRMLNIDDKLMANYGFTCIIPKKEVILPNPGDADLLAEIMGVKCEVLQRWELGDEAYGFEIDGTKFFEMRWK